MTHALSAVAGLCLGAAIAAAIFLLTSCGTPVRSSGIDPATGSTRFPSVQGDNLNGRPLELPAGMDAPYAILLVAFFQEQQADVDTWLDAARSIASDHANVEYYELPTIPSAWSAARWWVDGGMRSGIPAFAARERTVTIYTDTPRFRELAGIDDPRRIWTGLVDREGRIYWSARGPATPQALADLRAAVRATASPEAARFAAPAGAP